MLVSALTRSICFMIERRMASAEWKLLAPTMSLAFFSWYSRALSIPPGSV